MSTKLQPLFTMGLGMIPVYSTAQSGFELDAILESTAYIIDGVGWKLYKRNGLSISAVRISSIDGLAKVEERIVLASSKIPLDLIRRVTAFFAEVYRKNKTEAVGYLYYKVDTKEWDFIPPPQTATGASADYDEAPVKKGWNVAGTIHSHGSMDAFHSGTDKDDEKFFDGIHITIGRVDSIPEYSCSIVSQGSRAKFDDPSMLIDGMTPVEEIPEAWMAAIKLPPPSDSLLRDPKYGKKAEDLYDDYLTGRITDSAYTKKLDKLEEKADIPLIDTTRPSPAFGSSYLDGAYREHVNDDYPLRSEQRDGYRVVQRFGRFGREGD